MECKQKTVDEKELQPSCAHLSSTETLHHHMLRLPLHQKNSILNVSKHIFHTWNIYYGTCVGMLRLQMINNGFVEVYDI